MGWKVKLYQTKRGGSPVEQFIKSCEPATTAKIMRQIDLLEGYGPQLGMPHSKKVDGKINELRIRGKQEVRILYTFTSERTIILLHGCYKKRQKLARKDINTAINRAEKVE